MKRNILTALLLFSPLFFIISSAYAQFDLPRGKWWKHQEIIEKAGLTQEQIHKIDKISDQGMRKIIDLEAKLSLAKLDLENLIDQIEQDKLDLEAFEKQIDVVNELRGALEKERLLMLARIRNLLPKEAIYELKKLRGRFRERAGGGKKGGPFEQDHHRGGPLGGGFGGERPTE